MPGPLDDIRVIDLTTTFLGPYCTLLLGDMGADVVKVESPDGDIIRDVGPARSPGMGAIFLTANRSKRSVVLDLKQERGQEVLRRLTADADVVVHNMRPASAARLGVSYDTLAQVNPRLVYCAAYGFDQAGPYRDRPAYDDIVQGVAGLASLPRDDREPRYVATAVVDKTVGLVALAGILAALHERERTGRGQAVDVPMFETIAAWTLLEHMGGEVFDPPLGPPGYDRLLSPDRRPYRTADGHVCALIYTERHWRSFFDLIGEPEVLDDERYRTVSARSAHIDELYERVADVLARRSTEEWLAAFGQADIPAMPLQTLEDLFDDPQLRASGLFSTVEHPSEGRIRSVRPPLRFSRTAAQAGRPAPRLGEHTAEVLRESGYTTDELDELRADGVTPNGPPER